MAGVIVGIPVEANPVLANTTSVQVLAANRKRDFLEIQNNSAANIAISFTGATLTGIVPSNTNPCTVLAAGQTWRDNGRYVPGGAISIYQASGGSISTVSVKEG